MLMLQPGSQEVLKSKLNNQQLLQCNSLISNSNMETIIKIKLTNKQGINNQETTTLGTKVNSHNKAFITTNKVLFQLNNTILSSHNHNQLDNNNSMPLLTAVLISNKMEFKMQVCIMVVDQLTINQTKLPEDTTNKDKDTTVLEVIMQNTKRKSTILKEINGMNGNQTLQLLLDKNIKIERFQIQIRAHLKCQ